MRLYGCVRVVLIASVISPTVGMAEPGPPADAPGSAWGRVLAGNDQPVRHVRVEFLIPATGWSGSVLTDQHGKFEFKKLSRATFQVNVNVPGYEKFENTMEVEGKTGPLVLRLQKIASSATTPVNDATVSVQELKYPAMA